MHTIEATITASASPPLCVDLDGTLLRTDTLHEQLALTLRDPRMILDLPRLLLSGKARFKDALSRLQSLAAEDLPVNEDFLSWLHEEKDRGRQIILATAAPEPVALAISEHFGIFDEVIASTPAVNLRGAAKAAALVERFGEKGFAYAGDHESDLEVWRHAGEAILVGVTPRLKRRAAALTPIRGEFPRPGSRLAALARACRPHQWSKNLLVFVPLITAFAIGDAFSLWHALLMFGAFSMTASAIYVINDLTDINADRQHLRKRKRPLASGALPISWGIVAAPTLLFVGIALSILAGAPWITLAYAMISTAYSLRLKEFPLVDIFTLACLYTLRLYGGGEASGHRVSLFLLAFSSFLFLSLAAMKRVSELTAVRGERRHSRRDYGPGDLGILTSFGCSSAFVASLVLSLYVKENFGDSTAPHALILWSIVPLVLFWQCRMWLATARGYMLDDPIVYAASDWVSRLVVIATITAFLIGK